MSRRRVVAICIEVAGPDQIEGWIARGWMPNLARLSAEGAGTRVESVCDLSSGAIWPTFTTGLAPARHGQFFTHMQLRSGSYEVVKKYADDVAVPPFWAALAPAGMSAAIIDVPQTVPEPGFMGVHIVGWGGEYPAWPRSSAPPGLMEEILRRFGPHPLAETRAVAAPPETDAGLARVADDLVRGAAAKAGISRMVLERDSFDFFLTVFAEPHWLMHLLWHTIDESHPAHEPARAGRPAEAFRLVMAEIDGFIGQAMARSPDADVVVFSLSGMGANHSGWHLLQPILDRLGMGPRAGGAAARLSPVRRWGPDAIARLERLAPRGLIEQAQRAVPARLWDRLTRRLIYGGAGWASARAFWLPNDFSGAIRINLAGREPAGIVAPGSERDGLVEELRAALLDLENVATGRPAVREVIDVRAAFSGERIDDLPDLIVLWPGDAPLERVRSARLGEISARSPERRTGGHRPLGFLAAAGPRIRAGAGAAAPARIVDLAPTFLALLGLPPSAGGDGRPLAFLAAGISEPPRRSGGAP